MHVFPGGVIEAGDALNHWRQEIARSLKKPWSSEWESWHDEDEFQRRIASVREVFEETNILLTRQDGTFSHKLIAAEEKHDADWFAKYCIKNDAEPDIHDMVPFARWITPEGLKARFDTAFYLAPVKESALANMEGNEGEIEALDWFSPQQAIHAYSEGSIRLAPPTYIKISEMVHCPLYDDLMKPENVKSLPNPIIPVLLSDTSTTPPTPSVIFPGDKDHPTSSSSSSSVRRMLNPGPNQIYKSSPSLPFLSNIHPKFHPTNSKL